MENINLSYIIVPLLCISTLGYLFYKSNYSGEDEYQVSRSEEGIKPYVFCTAYVDDENKYKKINIKLNDIVKHSIIENFKHNNNLKNHILRNYRIENENNKQVNMDNEDLWKDIYINELSEFKILFNDEKKRLTFAIDHRYFGGLYFLKFIGSVINCKPVTVYKETYVPIISELSILKLVYYWITKKTNKRLEMKNDIDRLVFSYNYGNDKNSGKIRRQTIIYYNILKKIFNGVEKNKDFLRILITVGYESTRKTHNNVGALFIDFYKDTTIEDLEKNLMKNKYQAHAINLLQQYMNKGKYIRNDIDIVLTSGYLFSETNEDMSYVKSSYTTYLSIAHYPIYVVSFTIGDTAHVTITNMSKDVNIGKIKENLDENMVNIKSSKF